MKKSIGIIFGGNSVEHEISIISALQAIENIDKKKYEVVPIYLSKENKFYSSDNFLNIEIFQNLKDIKNKYKEKIFYKDGNKVLLLNKKKTFFKSKEQLEIDIFFPIVHGTNVEDGKLQGFLTMFGIPIIGATEVSAVLGQHKSIAKDILKSQKINQTNYIWMNENQKDNLKELVEGNLNYPVIIKPDSLGSSIGIYSAKNYDELEEKIEEAFKYDQVVVIEEKLKDFTELNISLVQIGDEIKTSSIEKVNDSKEILSYEDKYLSNSKTKGSKGGMASLRRELPAKIESELEQKIKEITKKCYYILRCQGIIRVDMMIKENQIYINEINNIPGSLSFYLWEDSGIKYKELLTLVIEDNVKKYYKKSQKKYSFTTNVLTMNGKKINK